MAIPIRKFGQYVKLEVLTGEDELVFSTDSLKIDFDIRHIQGFTRAKITLTNLAPDTVRMIGNGQHYVTIKTALHDSKITTLADRMYISNALEEKKVPESIFNMYCYSKLRRAYLENQIDVEVTNPTLKRQVQACVQAAGYEGEIEYKHFPEEILNYVPTKPVSKNKGSLLSCLELLGQEFGFKVYTVGNKFLLMYKPSSRNVQATDMYTSDGDILLSTSNMRANPRIGPATLSVVSNLDPRIIPTTILDVTNLLTMGTSTSEETLEVAEGILKNSVAGFTKYQTIQVQHKGSNWADEWITQVAATSPKAGTQMPTDKWWL